MSWECFEFWRHLWDDPRTDIVTVFAGADDCCRVLRREAMRRLAELGAAGPLSREQVALVALTGS